MGGSYTKEVSLPNDNKVFTLNGLPVGKLVDFSPPEHEVEKMYQLPEGHYYTPRHSVGTITLKSAHFRDPLVSEPDLEGYRVHLNAKPAFLNSLRTTEDGLHWERALTDEELAALEVWQRADPALDGRETDFPCDIYTDRRVCAYAWDIYNFDGTCLAEK